MRVTYRNSKLERLLKTWKVLERRFGTKVAQAIGRRIALLEAVDHLGQVPHAPPEKCHELKGDRKGQFALYTAPKSGVRVVLAPDHDPVPVRECDGGIDLRKVTDVMILDVDNYHEG